MEISIQELRTKWVQKQGIPLEDFLVLTLFVLQMTKTEFLRESDHLLNTKQHTLLTQLLARRLQNEPVAYLTGRKEFFRREFSVTPATLIPRPDSECLLEDIFSFAKITRMPQYILDIGTGSGALAITLRKELETEVLSVFASDVSHEALAVAKKNASMHQAKITFLEGSLLKPYTQILAPQSMVYIIANLPYVAPALWKASSPDVQDYEPKSALVSADQGLAHYKELLQELAASSFTGTCWLEISPEQTNLLTKAITSLFPETTFFVGQDLAGRNRFLRFTF